MSVIACLNKESRNEYHLRRGLFLLCIAGVLMLCSNGNASAQAKKQIVRLAKLVIDPAQLEPYKAALKEGAETAVRMEPGVLTMYAVSEKDNPTHFTILEFTPIRLRTGHICKPRIF